MSEVPFRPILDRVLIRRIEPTATTDGFVVPEKYRQHTNEGVVIALGDGVVLGREWRPLTDFLHVGDTVMYGEYTAERWEATPDDVYWVVRVQDIRGVKNV